KNGHVSLKVTRQLKSPPKRSNSSQSRQTSKDKPSYVMNSDVLKIAQREKKKIQLQGSRKKVRGILSRRLRSNGTNRVSVSDKHESLVIGMDPSKGPLQHVPKAKPDSNIDDDDDSE
ncbi:unnamed protein product, partial [Anisakis simplex]|uniref:Nucleolar GTP-binding protein 1 n=1 Tax=Anisakis simplex TaxID=6269 RepID=A0A0M3KER5_ANISI